MACEDLFDEYEAAIEDFTDSWDAFNDADNNLENAANDFWIATAMTWGAVFVGGPAAAAGIVGGGVGLATMLSAQEKFEDAKEVYEREYNDLLDSYGDLQDKSQNYCYCRDNY